MERWGDGSRELIVVTNDGSTTLRTTAKAGLGRQIARIWRVEREKVPRGASGVGHILAKPVADDLLLVPEMCDARIVIPSPFQRSRLSPSSMVNPTAYTRSSGLELLRRRLS
jgi:hypothetical protein